VQRFSYVSAGLGRATFLQVGLCVKWRFGRVGWTSSWSWRGRPRWVDRWSRWFWWSWVPDIVGRT